MDLHPEKPIGPKTPACRSIPAPYRSPLEGSNWTFFVGLAVVTAASVITRLYSISIPTHVAWDETHFGKHASWYIQGKFFFDVHPPLGKLIIAVAGVLTGYNGSFEFKEPGQVYGDTPYVGMRVACAILGLMVVPLAYLTVWELVHSVAAAFLTGVILVCETGTLILSRYILLDPPLIFFVMAATYCTARFRNCNEEPFDLEWWYWLALSGLFLGCAFSVKWVGLFVILLVGLSTAKDLWDLLGNLKLTMLLYGVHERRRGPSCYCDIIHQLRASSLWLPITQSIKPRSLMTLMCITQHLLARVLCLIITPVVVYGSIFVFHFVVLSHSGNGDGFFSSAFQSTLEGNELHDLQVPEYVAYGSTITLKNHRGGGGLLHSHHHLYPEGMGKYQQQQLFEVTPTQDTGLTTRRTSTWIVCFVLGVIPWVTAYTHKDDNNKWLVKRAKSSNSTEGEVEFIKHGDWVVLEHITTHRNLHSHTQKAPITESHYQVSCYGQDGVGDTNDYWQVEVDGGSPGDQIKTVTTVLKLRHVNVGCYLHSHGTQLPKWGWEQLEVTCNPQANDRNNLWNVEGNANEKLPMMSFEFYKPSMFSKFIESHLVMAESNNNMKPKEGEITSKPWHWPIDYQGQLFSGGDHRVYLLGNPLIFWGADVLLVVFCVMALARLVAYQRRVNCGGMKDTLDQVIEAGCWLVLGWLLHYVPFYLMGRVLYFHHYFPALMFVCMLAGIMVEFFIRTMSSIFSSSVGFIFYHSLMMLVIAVIVGSFIVFKPLAYGMSGPKADDPQSSMYGLKLLSTWDI